MAILSNFEFKGINIKNGYVKVGNLSLHNYPSKRWIATIHKHALENSELLDGSSTISFSYVKGEDPLEKAYEVLKHNVNGVDV